MGTSVSVVLTSVPNIARSAFWSAPVFEKIGCRITGLAHRTLTWPAARSGHTHRGSADRDRWRAHCGVATHAIRDACGRRGRGDGCGCAARKDSPVRTSVLAGVPPHAAKRPAPTSAPAPPAIVRINARRLSAVLTNPCRPAVLPISFVPFPDHMVPLPATFAQTPSLRSPIAAARDTTDPSGTTNCAGRVI